MKILRGIKFSILAVGLTFAVGDLLVYENGFLSKAFSSTEQPQSVVRVHAEHMNGNSEHGTGVLIRSDLVLTAHHVIRDILDKDGEIREGGKVRIQFKDGLTKDASVLKFSKQWDLALLQFDSVFFVPAKPAKKPAVKDQLVTICGFPGNGEYTQKEGRIVGFRSPTLTSKPLLFVVNNRCESGMSGGPVFNANGEVVGTLFGTLMFSNCTGLEAIEEFIHEQPAPRQKLFTEPTEVGGDTAGDSTQ